MIEPDPFPARGEVSACAAASRENAFPLLHEIRHALAQLLETGQETVIDVGGLPMGPGDRELLEERLGTGEVRADLDAFGTSTIRETGIPGVWWVEHRNGDDQPMGSFIEVTYVPGILCSQREDIAEGLERLSRDLTAPESP